MLQSICFETDSPCRSGPWPRRDSLGIEDDPTLPRAINFEYGLPGTPCETVVGEGRTCFLPHGVGRLYPVEEGYEGYLGIPITGSGGRTIGHLAFLDRARMSEDMLVDAVYRIFTSRAAAELEKIAIEQELARLRLSAAA